MLLAIAVLGVYRGEIHDWEEYMERKDKQW
jgi:hypothetical protein